MQEVLRTARLELRAIRPEAVRLEQARDYKALGCLLGARVPANWPGQDWEPHVLQFLLEQMERAPDQIGWNRYAVLVHGDAEGTAELIGCCCAFAVTDEEAEFGYSILPPYEGRGLATEAAQCLLAHLRATTKLRHVRAHTFPQLVASVRVLEKCGLAPDGAGEEPGTVRYRKPLT